MKLLKNHLLTTAILMAVCAPTTIMAQSASDTTAPFSAEANLDFQIDIPGVLNFRVGTAGGAVDRITFNVPAANLGDNSDIVGTGGDLTNGVVTVDLLSNAGEVTITPTYLNPGTGLSNGTQNIAYDEILTVTNNPALPAPVLSNAGGNAVTLTETDGVTDLQAQWTYTYDNTSVYEAGTYGGINTGGSRVTYTAAIP